jgi:Kef-type K+ transport system membrane component KefB
LFLIGLAADLIGRLTFLPRVTLLLLGGLAIGPVGFTLLPESFLEDWFPTLTSIALALIGFLLGQQLSVAELKKRGTKIVGISLCKVVGAWLAVGFALLIFGANPVVVLLLAGIAPATAPTATYDVVHESGATGEFAETLLSIVAMDDVWGLLLFIVMMAFAGVLSGGGAVSSGIATGFTEIGGSLALGFVLGVPMSYLTGRIRRGEPTLAEGLGFILLGAGAAEWLSLSPILTAMAMGATVASLAKHHERPFHAIEGIEWPFMILFFVLAGASLEVGALRLVGGVAVVYILSRGIGIYVGSRSGGRLMGVSLQYRRWLGVALFPQAGVAIGMALLASQRFPEVASIVLPVVLTSTIFLEIVAPIITRQALRAASTFDASNIES